LNNINESVNYEEFCHSFALSKLCAIEHKHNSDYLLPKVCAMFVNHVVFSLMSMLHAEYIQH